MSLSNMWMSCSRPVEAQCFICQYSCTSKGCACSYMHRECARELIEHIGSHCSICKRKIRSGWWQQKRTINPEERALIEHDRQVRERQHNFALYKYNRAWNRRVWPIILATVHPQNPGSVYMSFVCVLQPEYTQIFLQRWMDAGGSSITFSSTHRDIEWLRDNYETLPRALKQKMRRSLRLCVFKFSMEAREHQNLGTPPDIQI